MRIIFSKKFEKKYRKLKKDIQLKVKEKNYLFISDPYNSYLNSHALHGKYTGYRSFNVTGDIRIIYKLLENDIALFSEIGTHSELYS